MNLKNFKSGTLKEQYKYKSLLVPKLQFGDDYWSNNNK